MAAVLVGDLTDAFVATRLGGYVATFDTRVRFEPFTSPTAPSTRELPLAPLLIEVVSGTRIETIDGWLVTALV